MNVGQSGLTSARPLSFGQVRRAILSILMSDVPMSANSTAETQRKTFLLVGMEALERKNDV